MNKKVVLGITSLLILVLLGVGIFRQVNKKEEKEVIKIGAILPLTGPTANLANYHKMGIDLAVSEINETGGINGRMIKVLYEDSQLKADLGIAAFKKLMDIEKVHFITATFSKVTVPLAEYVKTQKISNVVYLISGTSYPGITNGCTNIYRSFINSEIESVVIGNFIIDSLHSKRVAIYCVNDDYGKGSSDILINNLKNKDCKIVFSDFFEPTQTEHKNVLTKIKSTNPDIIFLTGYSKSLVSAIQQLKDLKIKANIVTSATLEAPDVIEGLGKYSEGIFYSSPLIDQGECLVSYNNFVEKFQKYYPDFIPNYQSAATYSLIKMFALGLTNQTPNAIGLKKGFNEIKGYNSPVGILKFNSDREAPFQIVIKKMINSKGQTIYTGGL